MNLLLFLDFFFFADFFLLIVLDEIINQPLSQFCQCTSAVGNLQIQLIDVIQFHVLYRFQKVGILRHQMRVIALLLNVIRDIGFSPIQGIVFVSLPKPVSDFVLGLRALGDIQPIHARSGRICGSDDIHDITGLQFMVNGDHLTVHLGPYATDSYVRMNLKCKIQRRGLCRQFDNVTLWGEYEHLVIKQVHLQGFQKLHGVIGFLLPLQRLSQPRQLLFRGVPSRTAFSFFVFPMRRNTVFRDSMHLVGSNLNLERIPVFIQNSGMQGLVHIRLRHCNIVFKPSRNRCPFGVNQSQHGIAIFYCIYDDTNGNQVKNFIQLFMLKCHLLIDAVQML